MIFDEIVASTDVIYPEAVACVERLAGHAAARHRLGRAAPRDRGDPAAVRPRPALPLHRRGRGNRQGQTGARSVSARRPASRPGLPNSASPSRTRAGASNRPRTPACTASGSRQTYPARTCRAPTRSSDHSTSSPSDLLASCEQTTQRAAATAQRPRVRGRSPPMRIAATIDGREIRPHLQSRRASRSPPTSRGGQRTRRGSRTGALAIAGSSTPRSTSRGYLDALERMGDEAARRVARPVARTGCHSRLNEYLYDEQRFTGNRDRYDDPRNSFLNEVLDRRTGIPITLAVVYLEIARRAGVQVTGVNFPGHFLLRAPTSARGCTIAAISSSSIPSTAARSVGD